MIKITMKEADNMTCNEEKNQSIEIDAELSHIL